MIMCLSLENSLAYSNGISNPTRIAIKDCDHVLNIEKKCSDKILPNFLLKAKKRKKIEFGSVCLSV